MGFTKNTQKTEENWVKGRLLDVLLELSSDGVNFVGAALAGLGQFLGGRQQLLGVGVRVLWPTRNQNSCRTSDSIRRERLCQVRPRRNR